MAPFRMFNSCESLLMNTSLQSLIDCGTKLYLDSVDPDLFKQNIEWGAVGATSNPVIISALLAGGRYDAQLRAAAEREPNDEAIAWQLTDQVVQAAQQAFYPIWQKSGAMLAGLALN